MSSLKKNDYIPYGLHSVTEEDIEAVTDVLRNKPLTQGLKVEEFENAISKQVCADYCVAVNSATSALHLSCLALGVSDNDIVWTSPISFVASANCALYCGAKIDFVDINPSTGLLDVSKLKIKLKKAAANNSLPKVIIPVHLAGSSCNMQEIFNLSKIYNFSIIEDASHAIGAEYKESKVGSCKYSSITVFSFHPVKIITTGEGGAATTNDTQIANSLKKLRSHGIVKDHNKFINSAEGSWNYEQQSLGFNYRITDIQAALGLSQLKRLKKITEERNYLLNFYRDILKDLPISFLEIPEFNYSSVHLAIIRLKKISKKYYYNVFEGLKDNNIGVQLHYKPIYKNPYFEKFKFNKEEFQGAEIYESSAISIPLFPGLKPKQQMRIKEILQKLL
ncbi:UDP-4-amino-4,6-dideoxy-N-acetyl-beta-L-altrosamine transaminase [Prochlorococcus marinus]|uniref:UDP-4-amino-4, 6-dideoxy-N-acetyl-beta-L-altrosamine transaminase n=1 Tax=Prochlorococcus marinus TaxID=1219 RepID=UPI001ADA3F42|nr:UDP-4-amino-4,6-dideoxy-N-acetyl-beta-L-altrosamine transaminase [Prochlorococcus marinus]MBO8217659.1 UDP-4-amino-4,6-dideoxy-N-acetyl-beta-L-altrosamine transaminase [Prochlorococcus marinus XMU1405]MBW3040821.1 UDP-4-amino-4,6-dideoxy-N-acetyl-beta-L-altrosamine transaminase [Prochlorococcus marinus str. MU1405]MBW3048280.1 UDP-4-amino-4,6-dideoxy-N-acetyl-beta-L-altrosamine transaminase [Prochlorococcus marinus str. MU1406]